MYGTITDYHATSNRYNRGIMNHLPLKKAMILQKALDKAGVALETEHIYIRSDYGWGDNCDKSSNTIYVVAQDIFLHKPLGKEIVSITPTLSEMESLLPDVIVIGDLEYEIEMYRHKGTRFVTYVDLAEDETIMTKTAPTLLESVYEALLWCLEEGYIQGKE